MKLTLTDFTDIAANSLARKVSKLREVKARSVDPYSPAKDFYKKIRERIVVVHRNHSGQEELEALLFGVSDPKKRKRFSLLIPAYRKWLGKRQFNWFLPPSSVYRYREAEVSVNPELGLRCGASTYVIKLYFKQDPLRHTSAELITGLMALELRRDEGVIFGILDVERGKLFVEKKASLHAAKIMVNAELSYIIDMWESLDEAA